MSDRRTLRDDFAAAALAHLSVFWPDDYELPKPVMAANYAYRIADAMMERRKKPIARRHERWPMKRTKRR